MNLDALIIVAQNALLGLALWLSLSAPREADVRRIVREELDARKEKS